VPVAVSLDSREQLGHAHAEARQHVAAVELVTLAPLGWLSWSAFLYLELSIDDVDRLRRGAVCLPF